MNANKKTQRSDKNRDNPFNNGMKIKLNDGDGLLFPSGRQCNLRFHPSGVLTVRVDLEEGDTLVFKNGDARLISGERHYPVFNDFKLKKNRLTYELPVNGVPDKANRSLVFRDMKTAEHCYYMEILHREPFGRNEVQAANLFGCVVAIPDPNNPGRMFNGTGGWGGNEGGVRQ